MTKKHFNGIASVLKDTRPTLPIGQMNMLVSLTPGYVASYTAWSKVVKDMASYLRSTNSSFDRGRFIMACGLENSN